MYPPIGRIGFWACLFIVREVHFRSHTHVQPGRNRFYELHADCRFDTFPRCAISDKILELINGPDDPNRFARYHVYDLMRMHSDPASTANVCAQVSIVDGGFGQIVAAVAAVPGYDIWNGGKAKGSVSVETYLRRFLGPDWIATATEHHQPWVEPTRSTDQP